MIASSLKLLARDEQDLQIVASLLQDSIAPVSEMAYLASEKRFVLVVQRFLWDEEAVEGLYERTLCALDVEGVSAAQFQGLDPENADLILELLTILYEGEYLHFVFAGGGQVRLRLAKGEWELRLRDFGESWPASRVPRHAT